MARNIRLKRNPRHGHGGGTGTEEADDGDEERQDPPRDRRRLPRFNRRKIRINRTALFFMALVVFSSVIIFFAANKIPWRSMTWPDRDNPLPPRKPLLRSSLRFVPFGLQHRFLTTRRSFDPARAEALRRCPGRAPRLAIVLGSMKKDALSLMLLSVAKNLQHLGYMLTAYAIGDGEAHSLWDRIGCQLSILGPESGRNVDWSIFEGIVLSSVEAKEAISSLMLDPFCSIPLVWIVQEDTLGKRLQLYAEMGWEHLIIDWRSAFSRADVVVFPDFSLTMLHSVLDTGNFFVISGSPADVWASESYTGHHSKYQLRKENGYHGDDLIVLVIGSSISNNDLSWEYAVATHVVSLVTELTRTKALGESFKIVFLCGNSTDGDHDALQEIASRLRLPDGFVKHYGMDSDVNCVLLMADIVLYGPFQDEQAFPSLLIRAMSFEIPVIAPDLAIIKKYIVDGAHGVIFQAHNPPSLTRAFLSLIPNKKLSKFAREIALSGKLHARSILASEYIIGLAKLLENIIQFPSDTTLPGAISQIQQSNWEWNLFRKEREENGSKVPIQSFDQNGSSMRKPSIVYALEEQVAGNTHMRNTLENEAKTLVQDYPTQLEWDELMEMEISEDIERREMKELEERMEKTLGSWNEIYLNARKTNDLIFEGYERDEGELVRTGQLLCIYEIYSGVGAWPFLHHGALYRGLSLFTGARRSRSDDVDAVVWLPLLNDKFYRDLLCEFGAIFSIAKEVDNIHKMPWIGFQSWRAVGRKVSLSSKAEKILEKTIRAETRGDVIYYWARADVVNRPGFWSLCDIVNNGHCREVFEHSFRQMYGLPSKKAALPHMPDDGDHWSTLNSWAMPTPSFLEFVMFSRMFVDSLNSLDHTSSNSRTCLLGSSKLEKKHCYCRMLELLVNVWAYHSARKMVYINPSSGLLEEQHPIERRQRLMWVKYFDFRLLKRMDEDLAEEADDHDHPNDRWLWPFTGEISWKGIYEREREKMYKKKRKEERRQRKKELERQRFGNKQKPIGRS